VWLAWTATRDLRRSTTLLLDGRTKETLALLSAAVDRDMKGAWLSFLVPIDLSSLRQDPPYDFLQATGRAFARFPYPESFIVWKRTGETAGLTYAFNRADRVVSWDPAGLATQPYPVILLRNPPAIADLTALVHRQSERGRPFSVIETSINGVPYQVVIHRLYGPDSREQLLAFVAFTVNLDWVRRQYFGELLHQVSTIGGDPDAVSLAIHDEQGTMVAGSGAWPATGPTRERSFALLFFDAALARPIVASAPPVRQWTARARPTAAAVRSATTIGAQTFMLVSLAALTALGAMLLTLRAVRVRSELTAMKSEFVATVTHELKTPLALIKLVGETIERGRYTSEQAIREYAALLSQETGRLAFLIDNLLTYSRLSDPQQMYTFEAIGVDEVIEEALEQFRPRLTALEFTLTVDIEADLPPVRVDRTAISRALENVIDNAIKYSGSHPTLAIRARSQRSGISISIMDTGVGIPAEELDKVFDKFYRARGAKASGSGLGLTIARRIVEAHGGRIGISSVVGQQTVVEVVLPRVKHA
jgi:signal transduction histidine kinase